MSATDQAAPAAPKLQNLYEWFVAEDFLGLWKRVQNTAAPTSLPFFDTAVKADYRSAAHHGLAIGLYAAQGPSTAVEVYFNGRAIGYVGKVYQGSWLAWRIAPDVDADKAESLPAGIYRLLAEHVEERAKMFRRVAR